MNIREMCENDLPQVIELAEQLGYQMILADLKMRFQKVIYRPTDKLLVAINVENEVCGWIHLQIQEDMLTESKGEVRAFVVDAKQRSKGIGKELLKAGEEWIRAQDVDKIFLRTNIAREAAHRFYKRENYELAKTSHMFTKKV